MTKVLVLLLVFLMCLPGAPALAQSSAGETGLGWRQSGVQAPNDAPYIVTTLQDGLTQERNFVSGHAFITLTDGGANGPLTINIGTLPVDKGGTGATTAAAALTNLIGTPTKGRMLVADGSSWTVLAIGADATVLTADSAQSTGMAWSSTGLGSSSEPYVTIALSSNLSAERVLAAGTGISLVDGGANGNATIAVDTAVVATTSNTVTLANKTLTNPVVSDTIVFEKGANDVTLTASAPSAARSYNFPDAGAGADVLLSQGAQTKAGVLTLSSAPVLSTGTVTVSGNTITFPAATDTVTLLAATQSLSNKTAVSLIAETSLILKQTTANYTLTWSNPSGARAYRFTDVGGSADVLMKDQGDSYTAGGIPYADGSLMQITGGGSQGQVFTMGASNIPSWQTSSGADPFGGNGARALPTSGSISGTYAHSGNWTSTGTITVTGPTYIYCTGNFTLDHAITVNTLGNGGRYASSIGASGGGPGGGDSPANASGGGAGGANGGDGGHGSTRKASPAYSIDTFFGGSGGGASAEAAGGSGGGALYLEVLGNIAINAGITADGAAASNGTNNGPGGGAGGSVEMRCRGTYTQATNIDIVCNGGAGDGGGSGNGGGGGGGWIRIWADGGITRNAGADLTVNGGAAGGAGATAGSTGQTEEINGDGVIGRYH